MCLHSEHCDTTVEQGDITVVHCDITLEHAVITVEPLYQSKSL